MKRLRKGPELKMPDLAVPPFLADLYYDLRDRRLLPLVALVAVAIAAVPFLLGDPEEPLPAPMAAEEAAEAARLEVIDGSTLTVVESKPGLRDYRKRLRGRTPTDPFEQRYTGLPGGVQLESSAVSSVSTTGGGSSSDEGSVAPVEEGGSAEPAAPPEDGGGGEDGSSRLYELVIDVQITRSETTADGREKTGKPEIRHGVPVLTQLPGKKTPVVTTMGANIQKERLVFLVSHEVKAIIGEFSCITRADVCELLEVAPGILLEYVYEPSGARYAIKVTDVDAVPARRGRGTRSSRAAFAQLHPGTAWKRVVGQFDPPTR
jgi:hypothetical protein